MAETKVAETKVTETKMEETRTHLRQKFLSHAGWHTATQHPLPGDASFRRYVRLNKDGQPAMLMDAPPPTEDVRPFLNVARHLTRAGFSAPTIFAHDEANGFLLLEDFGDETFTALLGQGADEIELYKLATDTLIRLHEMIAPKDLPPYDTEKLLAETALFPDWFLPAHDVSLSLKDRTTYDALWLDLFARIPKEPTTWVLRDYHVDNLMRLPGRADIKACGLLDFQDALIGHPAYDLMSLLEDARRDVSKNTQTDMKDRYHAARNTQDRNEFDRAYTILAAARHAKVIGIFTRLHRRDGKPAYLKHMDRLWRMLEHHLDHPDLNNLKDWMDTHISLSMRCAPKDSS